MEKLIFGDKISVKEKYIRLQEYRRVKNRFGSLYNENWKFWKPEEFICDDCVFLGYRNIRNGTRSYDSEYGWDFSVRETFKAALICPIGSNPIYVPIESIESKRIVDGKELLHTTKDGE